MAGGTLILNFEESHLRGSVVKDKSKEALADVRIEFDEGSESRALKNVLEELQEMGHSEFSFVMTTLPPRVVSLRNLDLPFEDKSKAEQILSFELADKLPWDINEMECACITPGGGRTIAAAVKKEELVNYLNVFKDAGVEPNWIGVALFSKELLLSNVEGGMLGLNAFIDSNSIVASRDGNPVFFKNYNSDDELRFSIASLESRYGEIDRLFSSNGAKEKLSSFERTITSVDSFSYDGTEMASLKFQYEKGLKDTVNFRRGEFAFTERTKEETRSLKVGVVLLTLCLVLWLAFFAVKYTSIQSHSAAIDGSIANSYSEIFPGEKIIDPFYQMEGKVKALGDLDLIKSGSVNVLKVLKELSLIKSSNRSDATLFKVGIKGLSVSAKGRAASFESAKAFKSLLESRASVSDVKMTDVKATTANDVIFSVKFSMLEEKL